MNLMKTLVYKNLRLNKKRTIVTIVGIILATAFGFLITIIPRTTLIIPYTKSIPVS